ncbi:sugar phosphate nucleotidyltransferase [Arachnia propionica]|uniref:Glucose-1-phosphate cytidylyltransferase n=1 Tax=Arachnia propionica TaxID=1750 RepID=A0A3P1WQU0_9ACTN|nr:sugar phosphate nucleotidyltransferase [Arachnia propionica]RRD48979.1 glucose-1-phosphate cytidylyltransferase [Arachnia propionica]
MKVVLFCGGHGMRMRGWDGDGLPKPLQLVGELPLVVHVMNHYARYGHTEFVLCLGYAARQVMHAVEEVRASHEEMAEWRIRYIDTGVETTIGQRLWLVRHFIGDEQLFFVNYSDVLCDVDLDQMVARMTARPQALAMMLAVRPRASFHVIEHAPDGRIQRLREADDVQIRINGGYLILRPPFLAHLSRGEDLLDAFARVSAAGRAVAHLHDGFWAPVDTFKDRAALDEEWARGNAPWLGNREVGR